MQTEEINEEDTLAKLREQRLSRFRSSQSKPQQQQQQQLSTEELKEADRLLDEITNDFFNPPAAPASFKMEEELKDDFKDIFKVTEDELLDLIDRNNQQYSHNNNLNFMDELLSQGGSDLVNTATPNNNAELLNMSEEMLSSKSSEERREIEEEYVFEKKVKKEE